MRPEKSTPVGDKADTGRVSGRSAWVKTRTKHSTVQGGRDVFKDARERDTIPELWIILRLPGEPPRPGTKFSSPFRTDKSPSCDISKDGRWFADRSRGLYLDAPAFIREALGCSWREVRLWLLGRYEIDHEVRLNQSERPKTSSKPRAIQWPEAPIEGNSATWEAFAEKMGLTYPAVRSAVEAGLLRFLCAEGRKCFAITDQAGIAAEIRRCDNGVFRRSGEKQYPLSGVKKSWPIGTARLAQAKPDTAILITEGPTDLLAALSLYDRYRKQGTGNHWQPVALLGAGCKTLHPRAIPWFRGRRVCLAPDGDEAGDRMAECWSNLLTSLGCDVEVIEIPRGGDLRDIADEIEPGEVFE